MYHGKLLMTTRYFRLLAFFFALGIGAASSAMPNIGLRSESQESSKSDQKEPARFEFVEPHMGTRFRIVLYAATDATAKQSAQAAFARIKFLDDTMTDYRDTSELMQLCQKAGGPPVAVSSELFTVLAQKGHAA
jgi:thiamine biosynthesis lipoprotein ApbE